jgi:hypothetical protein
MRLRFAGGVLAVAGAAMLSGCTQPPDAGPLPVAAAPPPASAAIPAPPSADNPDGVYNGTSTRYVAQRHDCPHPGLVEIYVQNRQFSYQWSWGMDVPATIQPDGTIVGQDGDVQLTGHMDGSKMSGDLSNGACALHFTVRRQFRGT